MSALDVAMRLTLVNQLSGPAKTAQKDLQELSGAAKALGVGTGGAGKLAGDLGKIAPAANRAEKEVRELERAIGKAGAGGAAGVGKATAEIQKIVPAADRAEKEARELERAIGKAGAGGAAGVGKATAEIQKIVPAADRAEKEVRELTNAVRALNGTGTGKLVGDLNKAAAAVGAVRPGAHGAGSAGGISGSNTKMDTARDVAIGLGAPAIPGMTMAGGLAAGGILAVGLALKGAASHAMSFEDAMADVRKAVDGSPEQIDKLGRDILKLTRTVPLAKEELAALVAQAGFAGRPTEDLARFAVYGAKAAVAFGMGAEEAGDSLAKLANVWKLNQEGIEDFGDSINVLADTGAAKERDIISFLTDIGDIPKTFGLAKHEAAALGATLLALGKPPSVAATGVKYLLGSFHTATSQGKKFKAALKEIGLNAAQLEKNIRDNPLQALLDVLERIDKLDPQKRTKVQLGLAGQEHADTLGSLAASQEDYKASLGNISDPEKRAGSVDKAFKVDDDKTSSSVKKMNNAFGELGANIGPAITAGIDAFAEMTARDIKDFNDAIYWMKDQYRALTGGDKPAEHPVVDAARKNKTAQDNLAAAETSAARGGPGSKHALRLAKEEAVQAAKAVEDAMRLPGAEEALRAAMTGCNNTLTVEGAKAVHEAQGIANQIRAALSFTAQPVISPVFSAPSVPQWPRATDGSPMPPAYKPAPAQNGSPPRPAPQKKASLGGSRTFAQNNTFHITGSNPEATARAIEQRLARLGNNANALTDTA
ncbi:phage tail tape measure protein [Xanthobacter sp. TB0139]|uniref:phage tail tape measure protein n=1 Tax=Xanthobacter sp. TB0139 TaxID=3459178 RepID=UPI0040396DBD